MKYPTERTPEQEAHRQRIVELRRQLGGIQSVLHDAQEECPHQPLTDTDATQWVCGVCDKRLGTVCPVAPDQFCHFEIMPGARVQLYTGEIVMYRAEDTLMRGMWWQSTDFALGGTSLYCIYCSRAGGNFADTRDWILGSPVVYTAPTELVGRPARRDDVPLRPLVIRSTPDAGVTGGTIGAYLYTRVGPRREDK